MISGKNIFLWGILFSVCMIFFAFPALGAPSREIASIALEINAQIEPETDYGDEIIEIESSSSRYEIDGYEVLNSGFEWEEDTVPKIRITLLARDHYYFTSLPKNKILLKGGAVFERAVRQDGGTTLFLDVKLPALQTDMGAMGEIELTSEGIASWRPVSLAGRYEVRVYREGEMIGSSIITDSTSANCRGKMTKGDSSYVVRVRCVSQFEKDVKSQWQESNGIFVSEEQAALFREDPAGGNGTWVQEADGRWWFSRSDHTYPAFQWMEWDEKWYFFDEAGYMKTGWVQWEGKEYYCSENGDMLTNCITPDNYLLGEDGAKVPQ